MEMNLKYSLSTYYVIILWALSNGHNQGDFIVHYSSPSKLKFIKPLNTRE